MDVIEDRGRGWSLTGEGGGANGNSVGVEFNMLNFWVIVEGL